MHSLGYLFYLVHLDHLEYIVHLDHYVRFLLCDGHEEASGGWAAMAGGSRFTGVNIVTIFIGITESWFKMFHIRSMKKW